MKYKLLRTYEEDLEARVETLLNDGWTPQGAPFHVYMDGINWFCQALTKPSREDVLP